MSGIVYLRFDVLDHSLKFSPELLLTVIDAAQVRACPGHTLNDPAVLPDVLVSHLVFYPQRRLINPGVGRKRPQPLQEKEADP